MIKTFKATGRVATSDAESLGVLNERGREETTVEVSAPSMSRAVTRAMSLIAETYRKKHLKGKRTTFVARVTLTKINEVKEVVIPDDGIYEISMKTGTMKHNNRRID